MGTSKGNIPWNKGKKTGPVNIGEKNGKWKGDNVGIIQLHDWVRVRLTKPDLCQLCKEKPPRHLANMTGIYNRELSNWFYLCVSCHNRWDGKVNSMYKNGQLIRWMKNKQ